MTPPPRSEVIRWLATAASDERLGFFVGTGFSMAATNRAAPSFPDLLERAAKKLKLPADLNNKPFLQKSYPQIATQLVLEFIKLGKAPDEANAIFRKTIANLCNLAPAEDQYDRFRDAIKLVGPSWVITTNYDLVLEALMEHGRTVLPTQSLFPSNTQVPIYHLHGHRHDPMSIRVTEEDYVSLLAPLDYQRLKLPLLFLESTTLLLGYALGDINVRAAMEWSQSFKGTKGLSLEPPQGYVVQALYTPVPNNTPRLGTSGEIIIEIDDIPTFLKEIGELAREIDINDDYNEAVLKKDLAGIPDILEPGPARESFLEVIERSVGAVSAQELISFLERATQPIWEKAIASGGFPYYGEYLSVFLDILKKLEYREADPNFTAFLARSLNKVGSYFHEQRWHGYAWDASERWLKEAPALDIELLHELDSFAATNHLTGLEKLMGCSTLQGILTR